jgi:hypothetical protein
MRDFFWKEVVAGLITTLLGALILLLIPKSITLQSEYSFLLVAALLFFLFRITKFATAYMSFLFDKARKCCWLYLEIYITTDQRNRVFVVVAPFVVFYNWKRDSLSVCGYAFKLLPPQQRTKSTSKPRKSTSKSQNIFKCRRHANWNSLVIHKKKENQDEHSLVYLHDGKLVGERRDDVPGTTSLTLPIESPTNVCSGYFSDFIAVDRALDEAQLRLGSSFDVMYFDVYRASDEMRRYFIKKIRGPIRRLLFRMKLSPGTFDAFSNLIKTYNADLVLDDEIDGPIVRKAKSHLEKAVHA